MRIPRRKTFATIGLALVLATLFGSALFGFRARNLESERARLSEFTRAEARIIANLLEPAVATAYSFGALIEQTEDLRELDEYASVVMKRWPIISHISLAPDGIIKMVYPPPDVDSQLGLDILADPERGPDARRAMRDRMLTMTGPYDLKSGGFGITARYPVFVHLKSGEERFWGFATAVVDLERLIEKSGLRDLESKGYRWALSAIPAAAHNGLTGLVEPDLHVPLPSVMMHQVFASSGGVLSAFPAIEEIPLPNSTWTLAITTVKDMDAGNWLLLIPFTALAAGFIVAFFMVSFVSRARKIALMAKVLSAEVAERTATEEKLRASVAEKELLLREIHHRVKNNLSIVESIISLQAGDAEGTRFEEIFNQLSKRIHSITLIHEKLYRGRDLDRIGAQSYLRDLVHFIVDSIGTSVEPPELEVDELALTSKAALAVGLILTELCTNAVKYGQGGVVIRLIRLGDNLELSVQNEGVLSPEGFRHGSGSGLGLRLVEALSGQLDGAWRAESGPPVRFVIDFPAATALAPPPLA